MLNSIVLIPSFQSKEVSTLATSNGDKDDFPFLFLIFFCSFLNHFWVLFIKNELITNTTKRNKIPRSKSNQGSLYLKF